MTYANDCIEAQDRARRRTLKRIERHSDAELDAAVETAQRKFGRDFWTMLHGVDAYQERRRRRNDAARERRTEKLRSWLINEEHGG